MIVMIIIVILEVIAGLLAFAFWPEVGKVSFKLTGQLLNWNDFPVSGNVQYQD